MNSQLLKEKIINDFPIFLERQNGTLHSYTVEIRHAAFEHFKHTGFPGRKDEEWKYLNPESILKHPYKLPVTSHKIKMQAGNRLKQILDNVEECLVFINGQFSPLLSKGSAYNSYLYNNQSLSDPENIYFEKHFSNILPLNDPFISLNTAFAGNFYFIDVPPGFSHTSPLLLVHVTDPAFGPVMNNSRFLIHTGRNSALHIAEFFIQDGKSPALCNHAAEIHCEENSTLSYYAIQDSDEKNLSETNLITNTGFRVDKNASVNSVTLTLSGTFTRNNLRTCLSGEGANVNLYGLYLLSNNQIADNHTLVDHSVPLCTSDELYKGVLKDSSKGVFNGKIIVRKDAQKTVAYQSNRNLLLSGQAIINTKPQLEIFADDVKCSHGATSGQLDENALFYLRSRGIDNAEAKNMLVSAFAMEILNKIQEQTVREYVEKRLEI